MYARVAKWEGADAEELPTFVAEMAENAKAGPPPGVPSNGFTLLFDPASGTSLAIAMFATEEDLRKGHEALEAMNPTDDRGGKRTTVDTYEVGIDVRL
jgi:hypothetical protein